MHRRDFLCTSLAASLAVTSRAAESAAPMRVAVIGHTGRGNYGHGLDTLWLNVPEVRITAVADPDPKGLAGALEKLKVERGFSSYREMLAAIKPDIVSIGPRHIDQHHAMAMAAIDSGVKGIYMEKPFCRTLVEADAIVAACKEHGVRLALAHRNRYHPALPVIKDLVDKGEIGRVLEIRARGKEDQRGGGLDLWVLGSHVLNLAVYFSGPPTACNAVLMQDGRLVTKADVIEGAEGIGPLAANEIHARFETASGIPVFFDSVQGTGAKDAGFGLQLIGNKGVIDLRIDEEPLAHLLPGNPFDPVKEPRTWTPITSGGLGRPEPVADIRARVGGHLAAAYDLIAAIKEKREPMCSAQEGLTTVEMISATFESHRQKGQRVTFPLQNRESPLSML